MEGGFEVFLLFWPVVTAPLLKESRARPEAAAQSPDASPGAAGTGEDGAQRTLDATALASLTMGVGVCFIPRALRLPGESGSAVDLDLAFALDLRC
jgi:hypothetical protein